MSNAAYEITVYGDAPEGDGGGGTTDVIQIDRDMLTFYIPAGPTLINPPFIPTAGGGGDVVDPKKEWADVEDKANAIGIGFAVLGGALALAGFGAVAGFVGISLGAAFGLGGIYAGNAAADPPQPNYKRVAGSTIPIRKLAFTGTASDKQAIETILAMERSSAVFVDAIECAQGAFMASDVVWTQRHTEAARTAYRDCGKKLLSLADVLKGLSGKLQPPGPAPAGAALQLPALLAAARPALSLSPKEETYLAALFSKEFSRGVPTQTDISAAVETFRRVGQRLTNPVIAYVRFAFVKTPPIAVKQTL